MNIDKYIKWQEIWTNEIDLDSIKDDDYQFKGIIEQFQADKAVKLDPEECIIHSDELVFFFNGEGVHADNDPLGFSKTYIFSFTDDFTITDAKYSQG